MTSYPSEMPGAPKVPQGGKALWIAAGAVAAWALLRVVFFEGLVGVDDFHHLRYAVFWDRAPDNHWEARILYNAILRGAVKAFGYGEVSAALPTLGMSLLVLLSAMWLAWRWYGTAQAVALTGFLMACLPMDVLLSTTPTARPFAAGLVTLGTVVLLSRSGMGHCVLAGVLFGLGVWAHVYVLFHVVIVLAVAWALLKRPLRHCGVSLAMVAALVGADVLVFGLWTGDPLYQYRVIQKTHFALADLAVSSRQLRDAAGRVNAEFFWRPVQDVLASKTFGILGAVAFVGGLATWRRRSRVCRAALLIALVSWAWMSYGTQTPARYAPFPETTGYWHGLGVLMALAAAELLPTIRGRILRLGAVSAICATSLLALCSSGPWGQSVEISRELLSYVKAHGDRVFLADDRTLRDLFMLNGCVLPPNVLRAPGFPGPGYCQVRDLDEVQREGREVLVLANRLEDRSFGDSSRRWVLARCGEPVFQTEPRYRLLTYLLPERVRKSLSWALRRPPAEVCRPAARGSTGASSAPAPQRRAISAERPGAA